MLKLQLENEERTIMQRRGSNNNDNASRVSTQNTLYSVHELVQTFVEQKQRTTSDDLKAKVVHVLLDRRD